MPARSTAPPWGRPGRLAWFGALPECEVALVALAGADALALMHVLDLVTGQLAVIGEPQHVEVHVAGAGICVAVVHEALDQLHDLRDVAGGARFGGGRQHA